MNPQFGMGMGFGMPQMPMQTQFMMGMSPNENEEWLKGFQMGVDEVNNAQAQDNDANAPGPKLNVIFKTTQGTTHTLVYNYGITIDQALSKYLNRVGRPELYDQKSNKICFLFNASQLKFGDQTKIEVFFKGVTNPKVVVNDVHNLIGA
jgi:hypothetical protein